MMEAIIFIGLQASGKSSFYQEKFSDTHIRINLDMLKTRHREKVLFDACLEAKQSFVIDNTNPTRENRIIYIEPAKKHQFEVVGYYFRSNLEDCQLRNQQRTRIVPLVGLIATHQKLELPSYREGFDRLFYVKIVDRNLFVVEQWQNEI
jgi:predicted kinase